MKASILIPFYNDAPNLPETAGRLIAAAEKLPFDWEILFCDDGSTDGGKEILEQLALPSVRLIPGEHCGKGGALRRGVLASGGEYIFYTDADLAYGTDLMATFLEAAQKYGGVIVGTRAFPGGYGTYGKARKGFSCLYRAVLKRLGNLPVSDPQSGCKAYERGAAISLFQPLREAGYAFEFEILLRARAAEMPITELPVRILSNGSSHVRPLRDGWNMLCAARRISRYVCPKKPHGS